MKKARWRDALLKETEGSVEAWLQVQLGPPVWLCYPSWQTTGAIWGYPAASTLTEEESFLLTVWLLCGHMI
jgi:hypothetical protein